jgi:prophage regulatory protein
MSTNHHQPHPRLMRFPEVKAATGLCRSHIHALIAKGEFPSQIKISARASAWVAEEIHEWIEARINASRSPSSKKESV